MSFSFWEGEMRKGSVKEVILYFAIKGFGVKESDLEHLDRMDSLVETVWWESTEMVQERIGKVHCPGVGEIYT